MQPDLWNQPAPTKPARATRSAAINEVIDREAESAGVGTLGDRQRAVYEVIRRNADVTNQEIADILEWGVNRVTGRTVELREMGLVTEGRKRPCTRTGNQAQAWRAVDPNPMRGMYGRGPAAARCETCRWYAIHKMQCGYRKGEVHRHFWATCGKYDKAFK